MPRKYTDIQQEIQGTKEEENRIDESKLAEVDKERLEKLRTKGYCLFEDYDTIIRFLSIARRTEMIISEPVYRYANKCWILLNRGTKRVKKDYDKGTNEKETY